MKQRIAIDQDGVIANLLSEWVKRYNFDYSDNLDPSQIPLWNWDALTKPSCSKKIYDYLDDPELFENLPVIKDSQEVIHELSKRYEIFIVTAPFNLNNIVAKAKWLKKHFDFISEKNYVFTRNKGIVNAEYLIDDKAANFNGFEGYGLLYDAPHNKDEKGFRRMNSWLEIGQWFNVL